ncbi:hypothetical protein DAPPUDRAFT_240674 [Daphnia pulex]|uniref:CUB domain-containing protein n=1 Tax=Daphnia pulex TaxID=6669 RepID=E9GC77_DAPPU|nr:hypothetical protein DAPPUDRAFT_240674 [Daphnia pulex]|eukprot:EFX82909.1 hypothetical protein DAPPUDRAFT_240674 [Daphnia pulex]
MLLPLIIFSLIWIQLPTNSSAFNNSEVIGRSGRQKNYYGRTDPSLYYMNYNPLRPYWFYRPPYSEEEISSRFLGKPAKKQGNTQGNSFFSMRNPLATYTPCQSTNAEEDGICLAGPVCSFYGGRATGDEVTKCGALVTLNNTYWQAPAAVSSESTCGLTVKMDRTLIEQRATTCQLRLDFISFSISQPNSQSVCNTDSFQVAGAINKVPIICGDNDGQHMFLSLPYAATSVQLIFTFGTSTVPRNWRIKIAMLPCGADYLAPSECLQYFTTAIGSVQTFNWKDVATGTSTRQLANQDYYICFRTELVNKQSSAQVATVLCIQECQTSSAKAFSVSGMNFGRSQTTEDAACSNDYVLFPGGFSYPVTTPLNPRDRFCGTLFAQRSDADTPQTICTTVKPFRMFYKTNGDETLTATVDAFATGNLGFCLTFEHSQQFEG